MKKAELKKIIHAMIDSLNDKHVLYDLEEYIFPYVIGFRSKKMDEADDDLSEEQIKQLDETIRQVDTEESITFKEVRKSFAKWLPNDIKQNEREEKKISKTSKKKLRKKLHALIDGIDG